MTDTKDFDLILDTGIPLIVVESADEPRVLSLLLDAAIARRLSYYEWSSTRGLRLGGFGERLPDQTQHTDPIDVLKHIALTPGPAIYALCDFHPFLDKDPVAVRYLKDIALAQHALGNLVVLVSHAVKVPPELSQYTASCELRLPSDDELLGMVRKQAQMWSEKHAGRKVRTDSETLRKLIANVRGISHAQAEMLVRHAVHTDGAITDSDIPEVNRLKFELLDAEGVLHFEYDTERFSEVAGLHNLKQWLKLREGSFLDNRQDRPRGILLLGVQGGGKSLSAKAIAGFWGLPLLRLDFGTLYNKYFGESERNLRNSLRQAEMMAPCVLWMDEIEKGLATTGGDNATAHRILGTLLTWMAENDTPVFIVATSNDIASLPPELVRKGRLDEIFFVDLPDQTAREAIFQIHLKKRQLDPGAYDLTTLAAAADGFTGAEIEQVIVSARYLAAARGDEVTFTDLLQAVQKTYPLSVLHAETIDSLRAWARGRAVLA